VREQVQTSGGVFKGLVDLISIPPSVTALTFSQRQLPPPCIQYDIRRNIVGFQAAGIRSDIVTWMCLQSPGLV